MVVIENMLLSLSQCFCSETDGFCTIGDYTYSPEDIVGESRGVANRAHVKDASSMASVNSKRRYHGSKKYKEWEETYRESPERGRETLYGADERNTEETSNRQPKVGGDQHRSKTSSSQKSSKHRTGSNSEGKLSKRSKSPFPSRTSRRKSEIFRLRDAFGQPINYGTPGSPRNQRQQAYTCATIPSNGDDLTIDYGVSSVFICFANPIRDPESTDGNEQGEDDGTCEETISSTLYFDAKLGRIIEKNGSAVRLAPMPLYHQFKVDCTDERNNEISKIVATGSHRSSAHHMLEYVDSKTGHDGEDAMHNSGPTAFDNHTTNNEFPMTLKHRLHPSGDRSQSKKLESASENADRMQRYAVVNFSTSSEEEFGDEDDRDDGYPSDASHKKRADTTGSNPTPRDSPSAVEHSHSSIALQENDMATPPPLASASDDSSTSVNSNQS